MRGIFRKLYGSYGSDERAEGWIGRALGTLDPARTDPRFWDEFQRNAMRSAGAELARRRRLVEMTVSDVVFSWSRALVPAALVAAMVAFLVMRPEVADPAPLRLEEILMQGAELSPSDMSDDLVGEISFAVEVY
jgi:hypothetical protein